MRRLVLGMLVVGLVLWSGPAAALECRTHTYILNGQMITCSTCCTPSGGCTTTCL